MKNTLTTLTVLALSLALATTAFAHSHLTSSSPSAGQTLATSPAAVLLNFDEELDTDASTAKVTDASGATVSTGVTIDANTRVKMTVALKPSLPNGIYKVSWHSVADDDKGVIDGTFFFGVGVAAPSTTTAPASAPLIPLLAAGLVMLAISAFLLAPRKARI
ncbi:MAG TPA: copper resistance CopC family protein [Candidatus Acidoferrales bacterium]|nr:copper resistance CopC family protein [Candidatus Acidoferrales bacterium]